jgi:hypothetical protein
MKRLALALATLLLAASAVVGVSTPATAAPADSLYSLVNQERAAKGLPALVRNASIEAVAVNWANQMAASGTMQHNPDYSSQIPGGWTAAAENVAQGQHTAAQMNADWMNSPGHRANILGDFTSIGIAFVTANGTTWGVQDFAKYADQASPSPSATQTTPPSAPSAAPPAPSPAQPSAQPPAAKQAPATKPAPAPPTPTPSATATASPDGQPTPGTPSAAPLSESASPYATPVPRASSSPGPDATKLRPSATAAPTSHNPAPAFTLLGLALSAATAFIVQASRRGRWGKHRS